MEKRISLTMAQWRQLCREGAAPAVRITLHGTSMHPLIRKDRDHVTIAPLYRPLKAGDILLFFRADGKYVVHRLYRIQEDTVQTLGDGCLQPDAPIRMDSVWGIVTFLERGKIRCRLDSVTSRMAGRFWMAMLPVRRRMIPFWRTIRRKLHGRS